MPSLSKTAAKRQAHRESYIFRYTDDRPKGWGFVALNKILLGDAPFAAARRELAAWRAARVKELMGAAAGAESSKTPVPPAAPEARGDSSPSGGERGFG